MLRAIKNYWAFTKLGYRLVVFVVLPIVILLLGAFCIWAQIPIMVAMLLGYIYMPTVDIMVDNWLLGGFYAKNNSSLEYLQSSNRFKTMIRDVVLVDTIRRFILYVGVYVIVLVAEMNHPEQLEGYRICSFLPMFCFVISQAGVLVARHFMVWNQAYAVGAVLMLVEAVCLAPLVDITEKYTWLVQGVLAVLAIAIGIIVVVYSMKKVRDSYYDK